jgi:hypothetical protein
MVHMQRQAIRLLSRLEAPVVPEKYDVDWHDF